MSAVMVKITNLNKELNKISILNEVNMEIKKGSIYGLIGRNGAGKTTLMRVISGLSKSDSGDISINNNEKVSIGTLIERPAFFEDLDIYKNLEYQRVFRGIPGKSSIDEKLKLVGLENIRGKAIKDYSLGMKQKLGIAIALLGEPEFLVLDEPINGLDPVGIITVRNLLKKLNKEEGITILVSSHILSELNRLCDTFGIIKDGKIVSELSFNELKNNSRLALEIEVNDTEKSSFILENSLKINDYKVLNNNLIRVYEKIDEPSVIAKALIKEDIDINRLNTLTEPLEEYVTSIMEDKA